MPGIVTAHPDDDPERERADQDPNKLIDSIAMVMNPDKWQPGGGWISGPCAAPTEQVSDSPDDEDDDS